MLNLAILIGRLTADPELRYTPNGTAVATFTIATDRFGKEGEKETTFIPIVAWRKQAENCAEYLRKGAWPPWRGGLTSGATRTRRGKSGG